MTRLAIVYDTLAVLAILGIATFAALSPTSSETPGSPERVMTDLWIIWGLVPALILTALAAYLHHRPRR